MNTPSQGFSSTMNALAQGAPKATTGTSIQSDAIRRVENAIRGAYNARVGAAMACNQCLPVFEKDHFEQWMRATCEGADIPRASNEDSEGDDDSDSDS